MDDEHEEKTKERSTSFFLFKVAEIISGLRPTMRSCETTTQKKRLENVAIANALQLEAARRRAGSIPFNTSPVATLNSLSLTVAVLERIYC